MNTVVLDNGNTGFITAFQHSLSAIKDNLGTKFIPYYDLDRKLESLQGRVKHNSNYVLTDEELNLLEDAFQNGNNFFGEKLFKKMTQLPLKKTIKTILSLLDKHEDESKIQSSLEHLLDLFDNKKLKLFTGLNDQEIKNTIEMQALLKEDAFKNVLKNKSKAILKELSSQFFYFCHHIIEMIISLTGLTEVGGRKRHRFENPEIGQYEAKSKLEFYLAILAYPSVIFCSSLAIVGSPALAVLCTALITISTITAIFLYMRYFRPCPQICSGLENLNQKVLRNDNPPNFHRKDILTRIQSAFLAGKGVILTADPGVGKTTLVDTFAEFIVSKECKSFLLNAQLFSANANDMKDFDGFSLSTAASVFAAHKNDFVLFVDEIESIFKHDANGNKNSESFLTFHDKFKYIICATTTKQYERTIKNSEDAFNRRFVQIEVKPLKPEELNIALHEYLHHRAPELILERDVIPYIMQEASKFNPKTSQIDAATSLLSTAIVSASLLTLDALEAECASIQLEVELTKKQFLHQGIPSVTDEEIEIFNQKLKALQERQAVLAVKQKCLDKIKRLEKLCLKFKWSCYLLAEEIKNGNADKQKEWLASQACYKIFSTFIAKKRQKLGLPASLNKKLIDRIINQEI